jgi:hypothetical protein
MRCIRTPRYKLIRYFGDRDRGIPVNCDDSPSKDVFRENGYFDCPREPEMLYDLFFDPGEKRNLAQDPSYRSIYRDLDERLLTWMRETGEPLLEGEVIAPQGATVGAPDMISPTEIR